MSISLHDLMNTVESVEFDAHMSVFSGFNSFLNALREHDTVKQLQLSILNTPSASMLILNRLVDLLDEKTDVQYAHPKDVMIATYLYTLSASKELPLQAAEKALHTPNLMWAKRLAEMMLTNQSLPV